MRYVYGKKITPRVPTSSTVKIIIGSILLPLSFVVLAAFLIEGYTIKDNMIELGSVLFEFIACLGAGSLFLFLGIRARKIAQKSVAEKVYGQVLNTNPSNPFFTTTCGACCTKFDYQKSDLVFRSGYPNGYVRCPDCQNPIHHNAIANAYAGDFATEQR